MNRWSTQASARALMATFLVAFGLCVASFTAVVLILRAQTAEVGRAASAIVTNSDPAVRLLSDMRAIARFREVVLDDFVDAAAADPRLVVGLSRPPSDAASQARLAQDAQAYFSLPAYPGESALQPALARDLETLNRSVDDVAARMAEGRPDEAEATMNEGTKPAFDRLGARLAAITDLNAEASSRDAAHIQSVYRRADRLMLALNVACVFLTLVAGSLAWRVARAYSRSVTSRISELELFAGRLAHDLRSPLTSVQLAIDMNLKSEPPARARDLLRRAARTVRHVGETVDGLLIVAGASHAERPPESCDVASVLADVKDELAPVAEKNGVELSVGEVSAVRAACSAGVLANVVGNLAGNAIKYMGGAPTRRVTLRAFAFKSAVRLTVEDTGPGIPPDVARELFRPFRRGVHQGVFGLGLGLATVKELVGVLGGTIGFTTREGAGTTFWIELPRSDGRPEPPGARPGAQWPASTDAPPRYSS